MILTDDTNISTATNNTRIAGYDGDDNDDDDDDDDDANGGGDDVIMCDYSYIVIKRYQAAE